MTKALVLPKESAEPKSTYSEYPEEKKERLRGYAREYYNRNKEQRKAKHKEWVARNKDSVREKQRERSRENKLKAIEYLGGACQMCFGDFHPAIFEFHHRDPSEKDGDPSKMLNLSWKRLSAELDKCDLLCANCHRLTHHMGNY